MHEMALADAEAVPGIDLEGQNLDQRLDQPGGERQAGGPQHSAPAAEAGHRLVHRHRRLPQHQPPHGPLARLGVGAMGGEGQMAADAGDVFGVDEVEAGVGPQEAGQPQPAAALPQSGGEVAGGKAPMAVDPAAEHQRREHRHDALGQGVLLELLQAAGLGDDVFGAEAFGLGQQPQVPVKDAGGGEIDHLLQPAGIETAQQLLDRIHIDALGPLRIAPGGGGVDDPVHLAQGLPVGLLLAQITHQQADARMVGRHRREP